MFKPVSIFCGTGAIAMPEQLDQQTLKQRVEKLRSQREFLLNLLEQPDLGNLRLDVNQALEELDELLEEYDETFSSN
ncbi:hypothetical protein PN462_12745 [Spirulina sp. CS-785/01]|nr:hypothetical protein [Spirulina sp. CS-785/01]MDB9313973.1 hypothetical protein [Spirulina sp. CS-785/01]